MAEGGLTLGPRAAAKAVLHALKHRSSPVLGVLVAAGEPEEEPQRKGKESTVVDDAWALTHSPLACVPVLELALIQVDEVCRQKKMRVAGLYAALDPSSPDALEDPSLLTGPGSGSGLGRSSLAQDLLKIAAPGQLLLMLDSAALEQALGVGEGGPASKTEWEAPGPLFQVYTCLGPSGWARSSAAEAQVQKPGALGVALEVAREYSLEPWRLAAGVCDFEEHLEDISRDWLNPGILK